MVHLGQRKLELSEEEERDDKHMEQVRVQFDAEVSKLDDEIQELYSQIEKNQLRIGELQKACKAKNEASPRSPSEPNE